MDGGGYGWTDTSRLKLDVPDDNSVLAFMTILVWHGYDYIDLRDAYLQVWLRGQQFDLKDATMYMHVVTDIGRWHYTGEPMMIGDDWTWNGFWIKGDETLWTNTWRRNGQLGGLDRSGVTMFGFGFRGHDPEDLPTGIIEIDELEINGAVLN